MNYNFFVIILDRFGIMRGTVQRRVSIALIEDH